MQASGTMSHIACIVDILGILAWTFSPICWDWEGRSVPLLRSVPLFHILSFNMYTYNMSQLNVMYEVTVFKWQPFVNALKLVFQFLVMWL